MKKLIFYFFMSAIVVNLGCLAQAQTPTNLGERDPFQPPKYIDNLEAPANKGDSRDPSIDEKVEAIRRWPLRDYKVVAIMWDSQNPKVVVSDRLGTLHLLKKNYRIGNLKGMITSIDEGEIIVTEKELPVVMKIESAISN